MLEQSADKFMTWNAAVITHSNWTHKLENSEYLIPTNSVYFTLQFDWKKYPI